MEPITGSGLGACTCVITITKADKRELSKMLAMQAFRGTFPAAIVIGDGDSVPHLASHTEYR